MACRFGKSVWFDHLSGYVQNTRRVDGEPQDIPQVGRFADLIDPVGVALCAIRGDR